jgi:outer membrane protein assembly factor BamD (BamD/ComL family)
MEKRILVFFMMLLGIVLIPIILFSINTSLEDAQFELGVELFRNDQFEGAAIEFNRLLKDMRTKKFEDACFYYIGSSHFSLKNYSDAEKHFQVIVERFEESKYHSPSLYLLARAKYLRNEYNDSIRFFDVYLSKYPSLSYADNSLYWKGEALLNLEQREEAKITFEEVLKQYPAGNKAEAARFKLKLMELEEKINQTEITADYETDAEDSDDQNIHRYLEEIETLRNQEKDFRDEIDRLNSQIEFLKSELKTSRDLETIADEKKLQEKLDTLVNWENLLKIKENALKQKENELNREYERILDLTRELQ